MATETTDAPPSQPGTRRIRPYQIVLIVGVAWAVLVAASGIIATIVQWHDKSPVSRAVLGNIPSALRLLFYVVLPILFLTGAWLFAQRVKNWERGQPDNRATTTRNVNRRMRDFRAGVYMQTLLRDPAAGLMHSLLYFGFIGLFAVTTVLEIDHQLPPSAKFLHGRVYQGYSAFAEVTGLIGLLTNEVEKERGVLRLNWVVRREGAYSQRRSLYAAGCLAAANPCVKSTF